MAKCESAARLCLAFRFVGEMMNFSINPFHQKQINYFSAAGQPYFRRDQKNQSISIPMRESSTANCQATYDQLFELLFQLVASLCTVWRWLEIIWDGSRANANIFEGYLLINLQRHLVTINVALRNTMNCSMHQRPDELLCNIVLIWFKWKLKYLSMAMASLHRHFTAKLPVMEFKI